MTDQRYPADVADEDDPTLSIELPKGWSLTAKPRGRCRSCRAEVFWLQNDRSGAKAPFDADGTSHFATCPDAEAWRKAKRP